MSGFLPLTRAEAARRGWEEVDFVCITGDSYVDHPSFGIAVVSRLLESLGFRVGIISQPCRESDFSEFGAPRLGFMVTGGNIDSMVSRYTAAGRLRSDDPYTAGNKAGRRPARAVISYCGSLRTIFPGIPIIIGGLEASLRRFAHYDYWDDSVRPSILVDSGADFLIYGMAERQLRELTARLLAGEDIAKIRDIRGTCLLTDGGGLPAGSVSCASYQKVAADKTAFVRAFKMQFDEQDPITGRAVVQCQAPGLYMVQNPPASPLSTEELDVVFALPYRRTYHPSYERLGGVRAVEEVEFSIIHNRGCFGGCNFCAIAFHQGQVVSSRSKDSIVAEGRTITRSPGFKGYIHDVGGPTANFRAPSCKKQLTRGLCRDKRCLTPSPCKNLEVDHREYLDILRELAALPGVRRVFVRSGVRYDYLLLDSDQKFLSEIVANHVSGQLKVAPEHSVPGVLRMMGKPGFEVYKRFAQRFYAATKKAGKEQYLVPYLISSHPGATLKDAVNLALCLKQLGIRPEQVQDFYPTPGTASTCMFYTGINPFTMQPVYVARTAKEKAEQRALLQYYKPGNRKIVAAALRAAGRAELIGNHPDCLIPPERQNTLREGRGKHGRPKKKA